MSVYINTKYLVFMNAINRKRIGIFTANTSLHDKKRDIRKAAMWSVFEFGDGDFVEAFPRRV